ncbi:transport and golgi organization 6 [Brevipalpus obovatus]|uniref:transport and golgi organization 6 n=1 Tax=Brevipalpus obovatus TaxID=246614 RepID=UPI003D9DD3A7
MEENVTVNDDGDAIASKFRSIEESLVEMEREAQQLVSQGPRTPGYVGNSHDNLILRHMLVLFRGKEMRKYRKKVGENLSFMLIQKNGLLNFVQATCDLDQTSQKSTTFDQRFQALSTIITDMPGLCCPYEEYYQKIAHQILHLLVSSELDERFEKPWKLASYLFAAFYNKNRSLGQMYLLKPIIDGIQCESSSLTITECLTGIHHLVMCDFLKSVFVQIFPNLYFITVHLMDSISPMKSLALDLVKDMMKFIEHSYYLLDQSLSKFQQFFKLYRLELVSHNKADIVSVVQNDQSVDFDLKTVDKIVQACLNIITEMDITYQLDFFLILFAENNISSANKLLYYSLIDSLQETLSPHILSHPSKAIRFIVIYLKRILGKSTNTISETVLANEESDENDFRGETLSLQISSLSSILQIISLLLEDKQRLSEEDTLALKETNNYLQMMASLNTISEEEKLRCTSLANELKNLDRTEILNKKCPSDSFDESIRNLNNPFMPSRAHALVTLRRLIDSGHPSTSKNFHQLITLLEASLKDPESYVYIAAINALASLALAHTQQCLPILIQSFKDANKTVEERVFVGESLCWVMKYLGEMAHHFSKTVVDCFLVGLKEEDESLRVSCLSNLGQLCGTLRFSLGYHIDEIIFAIESLLTYDPSQDVKRACVMFVHTFLTGVDEKSISTIVDHLKSIYHLIKAIDSKSLHDPIIRLHAHLALEQIDEKVRLILSPSNEPIKPIKMKPLDK